MLPCLSQVVIAILSIVLSTTFASAHNADPLGARPMLLKNYRTDTASAGEVICFSHDVRLPPGSDMTAPTKSGGLLPRRKCFVMFTTLSRDGYRFPSCRTPLVARISSGFPAKRNMALPNGEPMDSMNSFIECAFCHSCDCDVVRNQTYAFVVLCNECGYAQSATLPQLLAS